MINRQKQRANNKFSQIKIIRVFFLKWKFKQGFCVDTRLIKGYVYWLIQRLTIVVLFLVSFHLLFINLQHISVYLNLVFWYDFEPYELKVIAYTWIEYKYDYEHWHCGDKMTKIRCAFEPIRALNFWHQFKPISYLYQFHSYIFPWEYERFDHIAVDVFIVLFNG